MCEHGVRKILAVILSILLYFTGGMSFSQIGPFFPTEALKKGSSTVWIGVITGSLDISCVVTSLLVANLFHVRHSKLLFLGGGVVMGLCTLGFGFADEIENTALFNWTCLIIRSISGASSFSRAFGMTILTSTLPEHSAMINSALEIALAMGFVIGPAFGSLMFSIGGFSLPFMVCGAILLFLVIISVFILETPQSLKEPNVSPASSSTDKNGISEDTGNERSTETAKLIGSAPSFSFGEFLFKRRLVLAILSYLFVCSFHAYLIAALSPFLEEELNVTGNTAGYYFLSFFLVGSSFGLLFGKMTKLGYGFFIYIMGSFLGSIALLILFIPQFLPTLMNRGFLIFLLSVLGVSYFAQAVTVLLIIEKVALYYSMKDENKMKLYVSSSWLLFYSVGRIIGAIVIGGVILSDLTFYWNCFLLSIILLITGLIALVNFGQMMLLRKVFYIAQTQN